MTHWPISLWNIGFVALKSLKKIKRDIVERTIVAIEINENKKRNCDIRDSN